MASEEGVPKSHIGRLIEEERGFIGITKGSPAWDACRQSIDYVISCSGPETYSPPKQRTLPEFSEGCLGFADFPYGEQTLRTTYYGLSTIYWAEKGLHIDDALLRLMDERGDDALLKVARFVSKSFGSEEGYKAFTRGPRAFGINIDYTRHGIRLLYLLSDGFGETRAMDEFRKAAGEDALQEVCRFVRNSFETREEPAPRLTKIMRQVAGKEPPRIGAYKMYPGSNYLQVHSTYYALDILRLIAKDLGDAGETAVQEVMENTPYIKNFIKYNQNSNGFGGFTMVHPTDVPDVLSTSEAIESAHALFWFNHPDKADDIDARKAFINEFIDTDAVRRFLEACYHPEAGGFSGLPHRIPARR